MKVLIESISRDLITLFAQSMVAEGKPNRGAIEKKLKYLCDEAVATRDREIIMLIKGIK